MRPLGHVRTINGLTASRSFSSLKINRKVTIQLLA